MSVVVPPGVHFSQFQFGGATIAGDQVVGLRNGLNTRFDIADTSGDELSIDITQNAHGFVVGNILRINNLGVYVLAEADNAADANVVGFCAAVLSVNQFTLQFAGLMRNLAGLTVGSPYYLSPNVAGAFTIVPPALPGLIFKPLFIAISGTTAIWLNYAGLQL